MRLIQMAMAAATIILVSAPSHASLFLDESLDGDFVYPAGGVPVPGESSFIADFGPNIFFGHTSVIEDPLTGTFIDDVDGFFLSLPENSFITTIDLLALNRDAVNTGHIIGQLPSAPFGSGPDGAPAFAFDVSDAPVFPDSAITGKENIPLFVALVSTLNQAFPDGVLIHLSNEIETNMEYRLVINVEEITAVPVPAPLALLGTALLGFAAFARRRRKT